MKPFIFTFILNVFSRDKIHARLYMFKLIPVQEPVCKRDYHIYFLLNILNATILKCYHDKYVTKTYVMLDVIKN